MKTFTKQSTKEQDVPFESNCEPNKETIQALHEIKAMKADSSLYKKYQSANEMVEDISTTTDKSI